MWLWLKNAWSKVGFWVKLLGLTLLGVVGYLTVVRLRAAGFEEEAADLKRKNIALKAEAEVQYLEAKKEANKARLSQIPFEEQDLDRQIEESKAKLELLNEQNSHLSNEEILRKFKELGY